MEVADASEDEYDDVLLPDYLTIGKGSIHQLYKYKFHHRYRNIFSYHSRPVELADSKLLIPGGTLSHSMSGKLVIIKHNKTAMQNHENDEFDRYLNWANQRNPRNASLVHHAIDQGKNCGSCWALAAAGSMEASVALRYPHVSIDSFRLSVQELIDCETSLDQGCSGGNPLLSFDFLHRYGLTSWHRYPYTGEMGHCQTIRNPIAKVQAWGMIPPHKEHLMKLAVRYLGPLAVSFRATHPSFLNYTTGIFDEENCGAKQDPDHVTIHNNHALLITGYGEETDVVNNMTIPFWIARNSWGRRWGEKGFVRIRRGSNTCGIALNPSVALGGDYLKESSRHATGGPAVALRIGGLAIGLAILIGAVLVTSTARCRRRRLQRRSCRIRPVTHPLLKNRQDVKYGATSEGKVEATA